VPRPGQAGDAGSEAGSSEQQQPTLTQVADRVAGGTGTGERFEAERGDEQPDGAEQQAELPDHEHADIGEGAAEQAQPVEEGRNQRPASYRAVQQPR
jgi:hypothetical protein